MGSYVTLLLCVQLGERVARHRAERLLADMRDLQPGKSTWSDVQQIRTRWGKWGDYQGTCTEQHCDYIVSFDDILATGESHPSSPSLDTLTTPPLLSM